VSSFYPVSLPRMDLGAALALARALLAAAEVAPALPVAVSRARRLLELRISALIVVAEGRLPTALDAQRPETLAAERLDAAWEALSSWLGGLAGLVPESEAGRDAAALLSTLFPDGRGPVRPPPLLAWAESEARLGTLQGSALGSALCALGGRPFLAVLTDTHRELAALLEGGPGGILVPSRELRRALDAFTLALHAFVAGAKAELADGEPESAALASVLFAPLDFMFPGPRRFHDAVARLASPSCAAPTLESIPPPPCGAIDLAWDDTQPMGSFS